MRTPQSLEPSEHTRKNATRQRSAYMRYCEGQSDVSDSKCSQLEFLELNWFCPAMQSAVLPMRQQEV